MAGGMANDPDVKAIQQAVGDFNARTADARAFAAGVVNAKLNGHPVPVDIATRVQDVLDGKNDALSAVQKLASDGYVDLDDPVQVVRQPPAPGQVQGPPAVEVPIDVFDSSQKNDSASAPPASPSSPA